jgi:predicted signal transduction protein with EAL and GGDEF domain
VDTLKIDRSFVIDMTGRADGLALVSTIINLAHSLKLKVVAEASKPRSSRACCCWDATDAGLPVPKPVPHDVFENCFSPACRQ